MTFGNWTGSISNTTTCKVWLSTIPGHVAYIVPLGTGIAINGIGMLYMLSQKKRCRMANILWAEMAMDFIFLGCQLISELFVIFWRLVNGLRTVDCKFQM